MFNVINVGSVYVNYDRTHSAPTHYTLNEDTAKERASVPTMEEYVRKFDLYAVPNEEVGGSVTIIEVGETHIPVALCTSVAAALQYIKAYMPNITVEETEEGEYGDGVFVYEKYTKDPCFRLTTWGLN